MMSYMAPQSFKFLLTALLLSTFLLNLFSCSERSFSEEKRQSYAFGVQLAKSAKASELNLDASMVGLAVEDVMSNAQLRLSDSEIQSSLLKLSQRANEINHAKSQSKKAVQDEWVTDFKKQSDILVTKSGVPFKVLRPSRQRKVNLRKPIKAHYSLSLSNGYVVDNSRLRDTKPATLLVDSLPVGWQEVLSEMTLGSKVEAVLPYHLAYGSAGSGLVPPFSALKLEIELFDDSND